MKYKIVKENNSSRSSKGKYKAKVDYIGKASTRHIEEAVAKRLNTTRAEVVGMRVAFAEVINACLRQGLRVQLNDWGLLKLEIESDKVENPEDFDPEKHIRGVRLHILPECSKGKPKLYQGIEYEKRE
ncbi:MAG: hypothetical protein K5856_02105 [Bacteroidaceae bacterium]|nr:hypothetical protein [Bacteroidaceae bacterium]